MKHFTIENDNKITVHGSAREADAVPDSERFSNETALARLAASWPAARLVEIWNSVPGTRPVRKFKDRATAVDRIWKAIQTLGNVPPIAPAAEMPRPTVGTSNTTEPDTAAPAAPQKPNVAPEAAPAKVKVSRAKKEPKADTQAGPREGSKTSQVIAMLKRDGGTTLEEIMAATGWLKHTTRAMLSAGGSLTKKHGLVVVSQKVGDQRVYSIRG